jgi:hypothetical protein
MRRNLKGHLYGRSIIPRRSQQPGKPNKGNITKGNHRSERRNHRGHTKHQEGMEKSGGRTQDEYHPKQEEMTRLKKTQSKRGPQGEAKPTSTWKITKVE